MARSQQVLAESCLAAVISPQLGLLLGTEDNIPYLVAELGELSDTQTLGRFGVGMPTKLPAYLPTDNDLPEVQAEKSLTPAPGPARRNWSGSSRRP